MADVGDMNLVSTDRVENEITQTRRDNQARARFVRCSSLKRIVGQQSRTFDKTSNNARGDNRIVLTDVSVNSSEVALRYSRKTTLIRGAGDKTLPSRRPIQNRHGLQLPFRRVRQ